MQRVITCHKPKVTTHVVRVVNRAPVGWVLPSGVWSSFLRHAELYEKYGCLVCADDDSVVGCLSVGYKACRVGGHWRPFAFVVDSQEGARSSVEQALAAECVADVVRDGCVGVAGYVAREEPSVQSLDRRLGGFASARRVHRIELAPHPADKMKRVPRIVRSRVPAFQDQIERRQEHLGFYTPGVAYAVEALGYRQWTVLSHDRVVASMAAFDASSLETPMDLGDAGDSACRVVPARRTRWRLFDVVLPDNPYIVAELFEALLTDAHDALVDQVVWCHDPDAATPSADLRRHVVRESAHVLVVRGTRDEWGGAVDEPVYTDPRDL